jgi:ketosteroid isomerase-like protein
MRKVPFLSVALIAFAMTVPAYASDKTDVMAAVKSFATASNKGDLETAMAACSSHTIIIDSGSAPYTWQGPNACSEYFKAFAANNKTLGVTNDVTTIGEPKTVYINGNYAYAMYPAKYSDMTNGKKTTQSASWTFTLEKSPKGWLITGWSWNE